MHIILKIQECKIIDNRQSFCRCITNILWGNHALIGLQKVFLKSIRKVFWGIHLEFVAMLPQFTALLYFGLPKDLFSQNSFAFCEF